MSELPTGNSPLQPAMQTSREYPARPLIGVGAFIFDDDGALLMIQRANEPARGKWSIPGGLVEVGETLQAAVVREVEEETGLRVEPLAMVDVVERVLREDANAARIQYHYVLVDYLCRCRGGALAAGSDAAQVRWISASMWQSEASGFVEAFTRPVLEKAWLRSNQITKTS
jgi:ADP-ribose pyrophosphatase YjhB (NUDIX family)